MSGKPKISVLIPSYNYGWFLGKCLDSVFAQTYRDFEVIVADDGSTDDTEAVALRYPVRYFKLEHRGISPTRNFLLEQAAGEFISFIDADDLWKPEKLEKQITVFDKDPTLQIVFCGVEGFTDEEIEENDPRAARECAVISHIYLPDALIRKTVFERCGNFNEHLRIGEDTDYLSRLFISGLAYSSIPEKLYLRRFHNSNTIYSRNVKEDRDLLNKIAASIRRKLNEK